MVLLPKLEYLLANVCLKKKSCDAIYQPMLRLIKQKLELPSIYANTTLWYKEIFGVISLQQKHIEHHISELFIRMNTNRIVGITTLMRLKQSQLDMSMPECILLSENINQKRTKHKNLEAKIIQHAKILGLSIAKNEFIISWDLENMQKERDCFISNILDKCNLNEVQMSLNKLNLQHTNQLLDKEQEKMVTQRQLKVREGKRHIGRKAKQFKVIENEI